MKKITNLALIISLFVSTFAIAKAEANKDIINVKVVIFFIKLLVC